MFTSEYLVLLIVLFKKATAGSAEAVFIENTDSQMLILKDKFFKF